MSLSKILRREYEVAFSKNAQPRWLRVAKYLFLAGIVYWFWGTRLLWIILVILFTAGVAVHFFYRYMTRGWTRSYGGWKQDR